MMAYETVTFKNPKANLFKCFLTFLTENHANKARKVVFQLQIASVTNLPTMPQNANINLVNLTTI